VPEILPNGLLHYHKSPGMCMLIISWLDQYSDWPAGWMSGIQFLPGAGISFLTITSRQVLVLSQPLIQWGLGAISWGIMWKQSVHEADRSLPLSVEVNTRSSTSSHPYISMVWCLIKHRATLPQILLLLSSHPRSWRVSILLLNVVMVYSCYLMPWCGFITQPNNVLCL
jgi:hypothetical protein